VSRYISNFRAGAFLLFPAFLSIAARAQLCTGSLGDPVVNMTFGAGQSNQGIAPGYSYTASSCPNDGFYTIAKATSACFNNSWTTVSTDHTGDNSGFMLVNASFTPGDFFVTSVNDLCPNTTYEFASWIMNVMLPTSSIKPNITFRIETPTGQILNQFSTGDITLIGEWKQYGFFFTTLQDNPSIVLRMTNNAPGGYGNDLALDDITFRPCGAKVAAVIENHTDTVDICEGNMDDFILHGEASAAYLLPVYQWQLSTDTGRTWKDIPGANTTTWVRQPTAAPGKYWYRMAVVEQRSAAITNCRISSNQVFINVHPKPVVSAGPDRIMLKGNPVKLNGKAEGEDVNFSWAPFVFMNDAGILNPTVSPTDEFDYTLSAESAYGCTNEDQVHVKVVNGIFVPNAFTPNNDGKNETWEIPYLDPSFEAEVSLFNRYGQMVYHVNSAKVSWDGTVKGVAQGSGIYVYIISSKLFNINMRGTIALIR
jgi:gliding motility-associated-like protein